MATLTDGERKVLNLAWQCFESPPQVDYKKLAEAGGYKTAASATTCYLAARKKILSAENPKLTDGERKVISAALHCVKSMPKVDYKKLQELGGYKTAASATTCYLAARKKLLGSGGTDVEISEGGKKRKADTVSEGTTIKPKKRAKKARNQTAIKPESGAVSSIEPAENSTGYEEETGDSTNGDSSHNIESCMNNGLEVVKAIRQESASEPVDTNLFSTARQFLEDHQHANGYTTEDHVGETVHAAPEQNHTASEGEDVDQGLLDNAMRFLKGADAEAWFY